MEKLDSSVPELHLMNDDRDIFLKAKIHFLRLNEVSIVDSLL